MLPPQDFAPILESVATDHVQSRKLGTCNGESAGILNIMLEPKLLIV
jgi:hypothetical protein